MHDASPLAGQTLAGSEMRSRTGAQIVGQWKDDSLHSPPAADETLQPGSILVAAGSPESIRRLDDWVRPITEEGPLVVVGSGDVRAKLVEILRSAGEPTFVVDPAGGEGVDLAGDILDRDVLERTPIAGARAVSLAHETDSATLLATTVVRDYAPEVPLIAAVSLVENVGRIQQAGARLRPLGEPGGRTDPRPPRLGEAVSHQPRIKLVKMPARRFGGRPLEARIRERTGCSVVAVERGGEVQLDIPTTFSLSDADALYVCGTPAAFNLLYEQFPEARD